MTSFIDAHRGEYGVEPICRELPIAPSTYYLCKAPGSGPQPVVGTRQSRPAPSGVHLARVGRELPGVRGSQGVAPASPRGRHGGALHGRAVDARAWSSGRGAGPAGKDDHAGGDTRVPGGPGQPGVPGPAPERLVARGHRAPRGALEPCSGERPPPSTRRSEPIEAEGSLTRGTPAKVEAALTTTGRASAVRWRGSGKRDGKVYARNQRQKASQAKATSSNLTDRGWVATRTRSALAGRRTLGPGDVAGREAMVKDCGVAVARLQGHSWAPTPLKGSRVNVGTTSLVPAIMLHATQSRSLGGRWCSIGVAQMVTTGPERIWTVKIVFIYQIIIYTTISDECR